MKHNTVILNGKSVWSCETEYTLEEWQTLLRDKGETVFSLNVFVKEISNGTRPE